MKNNSDGATPEALARALLGPVRKPKVKPSRSSEHVRRPVPAKAVPAAA